ncbi:MAG: BlaI/MecI/CopY family transcriptional regulator [Pseudomonadota bacterium]
MPTNHSLGDLQLAIMRVLWRRASAPAAIVREDLQPVRPLAPTTVSTMLAKMEKKGVVSHEVDGRKFVYRPVVSEEEVRKEMTRDLVNRLFNGGVGSFINYMISTYEFEREELLQLKQCIDEVESHLPEAKD